MQKENMIMTMIVMVSSFVHIKYFKLLLNSFILGSQHILKMPF